MDEMIPEKHEESEFEAMLKRVIRQRDRLNYDMYERIRRRLLFLRQLELLFKEYVQYQLRGTYTDEPRIGRNAYQLPALIWRAATGRDNRAVPYAVQRRIHKESGTEDILYSKNTADKTPGKSGVQNLRNRGTLPVNTLPDKVSALRILGYDSTYSGEATQRGTLISLTTAHAGGGYRGLPANTEQAKSASARISSAPMKNLDGRASETYTEELRNAIIGRYIDEVSNNNSVPEHLKAHPIATENGNHAPPDILIRADRDGITHNAPVITSESGQSERTGNYTAEGEENHGFLFTGPETQGIQKIRSQIYTPGNTQPEPYNPRVLNSGERYNSSPDKDTADRRTEALFSRRDSLQNISGTFFTAYAEQRGSYSDADLAEIERAGTGAIAKSDSVLMSYTDPQKYPTFSQFLVSIGFKPPVPRNIYEAFLLRLLLREMYFRYILRLFILRKNDWEQGLQTRISKRTAQLR